MSLNQSRKWLNGIFETKVKKLLAKLICKVVLLIFKSIFYPTKIFKNNPIPGNDHTNVDQKRFKPSLFLDKNVIISSNKNFLNSTYLFLLATLGDKEYLFKFCECLATSVLIIFALVFKGERITSFLDSLLNQG